MSLKRYSSEAVVISRKNHSEADRIIKVFSRDFGKLTLLAKGVRKTKSRKRGSIEVFSQIKFSAVSTNSFKIIIEALPINLFVPIRQNLKKTSLAYYFVEIIDKISAEEASHTILYDLLVQYLEKLQNETKLKKMRMEYVYKVLVTLGFWPSGKQIVDADRVLENVLERKVNSQRVGKAILI